MKVSKHCPAFEVVDTTYEICLKAGDVVEGFIETDRDMMDHGCLRVYSPRWNCGPALPPPGWGTSDGRVTLRPLNATAARLMHVARHR